ncbi:MAG: polyprenyl synthetase family protein [Planctomycetota bacterium]|nr:polyprenyl synthetase family protein [Planctomycetota bacterium]
MNHTKIQANATTIATVNAASLMSESAAHVSDYFRRLPQRYPTAPIRLMEAIDYSLMAGGKRLRPALVLECAKACHEGRSPLPNSPCWPSALAAAAAMELIHTFSLVHDDLPAMDDDDLRRGQPTNHKIFGEAMAILAGDAMTTIAFEILATDAQPAVAPSLIAELAHSSGPGGMIGGQVIDMDNNQRPTKLSELQHLHRMKTGALLTASCRMGAIAVGASEEKLQALSSFGRHVGLAFQIVDDILDQTATPEQIGKATGKDAAKGKITYPVLIGLDASRREADQALAAAIRAITPLGAAAAGLISLARFVGERNI